MTPIQRFIDNAFAEQERRHADIIAAGEQIRRRREEEQYPREREAGNRLPANQ